VPLFSAVVGFTLAVALLIATIGFGTSLQRVLDTPRLYGWTWDLQTGAPALPNIGGLVVPALRADDDISAAAAGTVVQVDLQDRRVDALAMTVVKGDLDPAMIKGRAPRGAGELLVGVKTLADIDADVGDTVTIRIGDSAVPLRIVGTAVFPPYGDNGQFGTGALMSYGQLQELLPAAKQNVFLLELAPDVSLEREYRHMRDALEPLPTRLARTPTDLENLTSVGGLQVTLVAILAILGAGTLAHTMITSVRRRRSNIALLRSMGFARRQVWGVVLVQALTLAVVALVLGVVLGLIGARVAWTIFADHLGLTAGRVFPWTGLLVMIPTALALTVAIAALPAYLAGRTRPAAVLREE
jgi:putative ABC transport system permease protein